MWKAVYCRISLPVGYSRRDQLQAGILLVNKGFASTTLFVDTSVGKFQVCRVCSFEPGHEFLGASSEYRPWTSFIEVKDGSFKMKVQVLTHQKIRLMLSGPNAKSLITTSSDAQCFSHKFPLSMRVSLYSGILGHYKTPTSVKYNWFFFINS